MREEELEKLAEKLKRNNFPLKKEWLKTCVEYLEQSIGKKPISPDTLQNLIIHQFIHSDISESYQPLMRIPKKAVKVVVVKKMIFQLQSYTNISISMYEQLSEATRHTDDLSWFHGITKGIEEENGENGEKEKYVEPPRPSPSDKNNNSSKNGNSWQPKKKRGMLKLELTDGQNTINAVELEEMFQEKTLLPGVKLILTGKVTCRRGTLLLNKSNCQLIGGHVDSVKFDLVKKLSEALKIDLDSEKNRRRDSLGPLKIQPLPLKVRNPNPAPEKNPEKNSKKKNENSGKKSANTSKMSNKSMLNQSTLSPFLMKTDRKTGEVKNPEKPIMTAATQKPKPVEEPTENWDFSIEERPVPQSPTPEPPEAQEYDPIENWQTEHEKPKTPPKKPENPKIIPKIGARNSKILKKNPEKTVEKPQEKEKNLEDSEKILEKLSEKWEKQKEKSVQDWTFNLSSSFENVPRTSDVIKKPAKPMVKKLPEQLLRVSDDEIEEILEPSRPNHEKNPQNQRKPEEIEKSVVSVEKKKDPERDWDRKGSEEEEVPVKRQKESREDLVVLPSCFFKEKNRGETQAPPPSKPSAPPSFAKTIHGPRYNGKPLPKRPDLDTITSHFPTVKYTHNGSKKSISIEEEAPVEEVVKKTRPLGFPTKLQSEIIEEARDAEKEAEVENEELEEEIESIDEEEEERRIVQTILAKIKQNQPSLLQNPPTVTQAPPICQPDPVESPEFLDQEVDQDDSILECTIEQEGRQELERWGLVAPGKLENQDYGYHPPNQSIINMPDTFLPSQSQIPYQQPYQSHQNQWIPQNDNFMAPPRVKLETMEMEETQRNVAVIRKRRDDKGIEEEIKNKQSDNVQIYRTPFAKRIPSTDPHCSSSSSATEQLFQRMADLQIVPLGDALMNRKFWMMSKIVVVMPTICVQVHELNSDGVDWQLKMRVSDTSASDVTCLVATSLLNRIFGFTVQQCKQLFHAKQLDELRHKKAEAERKLVGFKRLDLLMWIEVSPEIDKLPMILDVKTLSDALNIL